MSQTETLTNLELGTLRLNPKPIGTIQKHHDEERNGGRLSLPSQVLTENINDGHPNSDNGSNSTPPTTAITSEPVAPGKTQSALLLTTLATVSLLNTLNQAMMVVALPAMSEELAIPESLLLWPASVYSLGLAACLLLIGAIADVVGNRPIFLAGSLLYTSFTLAVSLSRTADQLIAFRALQGIAMAFCMPPAVSTITTTFPAGRARNVAFSVFGGGSPVGFAVGLVLGGVFIQVSTWRTGYWMSTAINAAQFVLAWFVLPRRDEANLSGKELRNRLAHDFDWIGVGSASATLALLSYLFAEIAHGAGSVFREARPHAIILLVLVALLIPFFVFWEGRQERLGRPTVLPNSVWKRHEFTTVCVAVFLTWSWFNSFSYWSTLYFQITQKLDALQTALRFLPLVVVGLGTNIVAGLIMDRVNAAVIGLVGGMISAAGPIIFALMDPAWPYWWAALPAMVVSVVSTDLLFNISNLVITTNFPRKSQALAGGVFQTVAHLGNSIGLAATAIIAASVTDAAGRGTTATSGNLTFDSAVLQGYRSGFWTCFAAVVVSTVVSTVGLRKAGKVGKKKEL